ncbi:VIR protein [Plasmodium vivax]|uniref:VIR protein n=1 Tax=Plasmodium vivax TaxID=5855 RepID=A0A1G4E8A4_PLAVI|nr:VIR protein [Plasmodium vivax]
MAKRATDEVFLNYDDYSVIKKVVGPHRDHVFDTKYDVILEDAKVETSKREMYGKSYKEIYRHLHSGGVMYNYMVQGCKYISYLIHEEVKNILELHYNEEIFKIFHKFVVDYFSYRGLSKDSCLPHVVYVDQDMYEDLGRLYRLYNKYNEVLSSNKDWDERKCLFFKFFVNDYNDYMEKNKPTSLNLNKILTHLEGKVRNTINGLGRNCSSLNYKLTPIVPYFKPEDVKPINKPELETHSLKTLQQQVTNPQARTTEEETHLKSPPTHPVIQETKITHPIQGLNQAGKIEEDPIREEASDTGFHMRQLYDHRTPMTHPRNETVRQSQYGPTLEFPERLGLKDDQSINAQNGLETEQGFATSVRNTITEVLGSVDPVPVVGVSGGMGALFLLFRYTPVGTFFRGRGYRQRIPTRFDGVYPGFMTDFQGYGDGYFPNDRINITYGPE